MSQGITAANVKLKRAYERSDAVDGSRIPIDRLWPRGVDEAEAAIAEGPTRSRPARRCGNGSATIARLLGRRRP